MTDPPFKRRRCLIAADGFYEWKQEETGKRPVWISRDGEIFAFAGIWASLGREGRSRCPAARSSPASRTVCCARSTTGCR